MKVRWRLAITFAALACLASVNEKLRAQTYQQADMRNRGDVPLALLRFSCDVSDL